MVLGRLGPLHVPGTAEVLKLVFSGKLYNIEAKHGVWPLLLVSANLFWLVLTFLRSLQSGEGTRRFVDRYFIEIAVVFMSLLQFWYVFAVTLDWCHISIGLRFAYLASAVIVLRNYAPRCPTRLWRPAAWTTLGLVVLWWCAACGREIDLEKNFPYRQPDSRFLRSEYVQAANFLNRNLGKDETFYTLTSEGAFYYLVDRPSPSRFFLLFDAAPVVSQCQLVRDLDSHRVKYVVVYSPSWTNSLNYFTVPMRTPLVTRYVAKNYHSCIWFGQILYRGEEPTDGKDKRGKINGKDNAR